MKYKFFNIVLAAVVVCMSASSCARSYEEDTDSLYQRVMGAWIRVNYPESENDKTESGAYILEYNEGNGQAVSDTGFVFAHYIKYTLDGSISTTNREDVSKRLGSYEGTDYYGSDIWQLGQGYLPEGIEEALKNVKVGTHIKIALPVAASEVTTTLYNAFSSYQASDNMIYEITIDGCTEDIDEYQTAEMESFRAAYWPQADTLVKNLYFLTLGEAAQKSSDDDTLYDGRALSVRYIGKLLNGQVFDTNIQDTAKKYRIYDSSNEYEALDVDYYADIDDFMSNNSLVEGFSRAIINMDLGQTAVTFFSSDYGYGEAGSNKSIPEYSPLFFYIYIEEDSE